MWNTPALVRWNVSKGLLLGSGPAAACDVVPTEILEGEDASLRRVLAARGWSDVIVKPLISASGQ